eukprot:scaffold91487_cov30-Tisochrysis_lutea.AAC.3
MLPRRTVVGPPSTAGGVEVLANWNECSKARTAPSRPAACTIELDKLPRDPTTRALPYSHRLPGPAPSGKFSSPQPGWGAEAPPNQQGS